MNWSLGWFISTTAKPSVFRENLPEISLLCASLMPSNRKIWKATHKPNILGLSWLPCFGWLPSKNANCVFNEQELQFCWKERKNAWGGNIAFYKYALGGRQLSNLESNQDAHQISLRLPSPPPRVWHKRGWPHWHSPICLLQRRKHSCVVPNLSRKMSSFSPVSIMLSVGFFFCKSVT